MASIQSAINSMISSASHAITTVKGYQVLKAKQAAKTANTAEKSKAGQNSIQPQRRSVQAMAAEKAKQSANDAITAKRIQRTDFMAYLRKQPSSLGPIGELDPALQQQIAAHYTPSMRKRLMDAADKEAKKNGKHK